MPLAVSNPKDAYVDERLRAAPIIWLSTVRPDGRPHLVPVWFFWDGETITIYSQPGTQKMRNLRQNSSVALALDSADEGYDVLIIEGQAELMGTSAQTVNTPAYVAKYDALLKQLQADPDQLAADFSEVIRVTPTKFMSWARKKVEV